MRTTLDKQAVNDLVLFFLRLGGWYVEPGVDNIPSIMHLAFDDPSLMVCTGGTQSPALFHSMYRAGFPMTRTMVRVSLLRRLLDTGAQLEAWHGEIPLWGDIHRTRICDYDGNLRFPLGDPSGVPTNGGALRAVACDPDPQNSVGLGFQERFWCFGGSAWPLVTFIPKDQPGASPKSFFWSSPGQRAMDFDSIHFADMAGAFASGELRPTHIDDYASNLSPEMPGPIVHVLL